MYGEHAPVRHKPPEIKRSASPINPAVDTPRKKVRCDEEVLESAHEVFPGSWTWVNLLSTVE